MGYLLMLGAVMMFTIQTLCFKEFNRTFMKNLASYFIFNFLYFSVIVIVFLWTTGIPKSFHPYTIALGISFGVLFVWTIFCYMKAMESGPLSYSSLFFSFGIIIPIIYGLLFWGERVGILQGMGLFLLLTTFYLGSEPSEGGENKINVKWLLLCIVAFIGNGSLMTISKSHQVLLPGQQVREFLILAFGTAALLSLLLFVLYYGRGKQRIDHFRDKPMLLGVIILGTGLTTAFGNQLALYLASRVPSVVQFPFVSGGIVIVSTVVSSFLFNERVSRRGVAGLTLGLVALIMLSAR